MTRSGLVAVIKHVKRGESEYDQTFWIRAAGDLGALLKESRSIGDVSQQAAFDADALVGAGADAFSGGDYMGQALVRLGQTQAQATRAISLIAGYKQTHMGEASVHATLAAIAVIAVSDPEGAKGARASLEARLHGGAAKVAEHEATASSDDVNGLLAVAAASQAAYPNNYVTVYRGIGVPTGHEMNEGDDVDLSVDALSSWSEDREVAMSFAKRKGEHGRIITTEVPRSSIVYSDRVDTLGVYWWTIRA